MPSDPIGDALRRLIEAGLASARDVRGCTDFAKDAERVLEESVAVWTLDPTDHVFVGHQGYEFLFFRLREWRGSSGSAPDGGRGRQGGVSALLRVVVGLRERRDSGVQRDPQLLNRLDAFRGRTMAQETE